MRIDRRLHGVVADALSSLAPPPELRPSQWAEANVVIPSGNAIPGLISFRNAPYQREPLDCTADPAVRRISLQWGAQTGKSQVALCAQAYRIDQDPTSQMAMQPSEGDLMVWLETKFAPLIDANPALAAKLGTGKGRRGVNNSRLKSYPGGFLMFAWAGSPKTMRGRSAPFIVADEVDGYERTKEGHPVSLLWQRAATFGDLATLLELSTPTIKGASYIEGAYDAGDGRQFHVPCPHCAEPQVLRWEQVRWDKSEAGDHLPATASCVCAFCGVLWSEADRVAAIRDPRARWIAQRPFIGHASFHISELYSLFRRLSDVVQSFVDKKRAGDLQTFVNVSLAETWEEAGERVDAVALMQRAVKFPAPVPRGVGALTAGVDMQEDRLEVEVVGWGLGEESWSVEHRVLWGDPLRADVWQDLDALLSETWRHEFGAELSLIATCLDTGGSGGLTQAAYEWVRGRFGQRVFGIKGQGGWGLPVVGPASKRRTRRARTIRLFPVGVDEAKVIVTRRFALEDPGPGYCWLPSSRDPEWFAQATAETLRTRLVRGFGIREWHKMRERNEALDCRVYAYAALKLANPNLARLVAALEPEEDPDGEGPGPIPDPVIPASEADGAGKARAGRGRRRKGRGGWVNSW